MTILYDSNAARRAVNRIRLMGIAALAACLIIAVAGLARHQQAYSGSDQGQDSLWVAQR